jgi:hypothetical protein
MGAHASPSPGSQGNMSRRSAIKYLRKTRPDNRRNPNSPRHRQVNLIFTSLPCGIAKYNSLWLTFPSTRSLVVVLGIIGLLCVFHRRKQRLDKLEDLKNVQELDDYGLAPVKPKPVQLPQAPPPTYERSQDRKADGNWGKSHRDSTDSLTPSLRQAMGVTPRDALANSG